MSDYDSKAIEDKAVNEVIRYFEDSKIVATYITNNDKEPFFDGHLYLYGGGQRDNDHYTSRVAVQVKGKDLGEFKDGVFSYPIEMTDLKAYLHEGVAFFVVQEVKRKKRMFYKLLTPIELRTIISEKGNQQSVSVRMTRTTDRDLKRMEVSLLQFAHDCTKQVSFADSLPLDFADLQKKGIHSFSIDVTVKDPKESFFVAVTQDPVYIYGNLSESIKVPLGMGSVNIALLKDVEQPVTIGGKVFYEKFKTKIEGGLLTIKTADCFSVTVDPTGKKKQANLNVSRKAKYLKEVIREAEFLLALQQTKEVSFGTALTLPIPFPDEHPLTEGLDKHLKAWHALDDLLLMICCDKDIDMSLIKKKDERTIDILIDMVGKGHERNLKNVTLGINNIKVANLNLWLFIYKNQDNNHVIKSFFDPSLGVQALYDYPEGRLEESMFSWFDRKMISECDNLPYTAAIQSYENLKSVNPHIYERGNIFLLELIAAYDMEEDEHKKVVMYQSALEINEWLMKSDVKENNIVHQLNRYQLIKRGVGLDDSDNAELKRIRLDNSEDIQISYAASLLLGDKESYMYFWNKMDAQTQKTYRERMPVFKFHIE